MRENQARSRNGLARRGKSLNLVSITHGAEDVIYRAYDSKRSLLGKISVDAAEPLDAEYVEYFRRKPHVVIREIEAGA